MRNYKKLNRLFESVETPQMSMEMANCGLSEFMTKLDSCCMDNPELQTKVDSLKTMIGQVCMEPAVTAVFSPMPAAPAQPEPTMEDPMSSDPNAISSSFNFINDLTVLE
jgi:hypothetical protein